MTRRIGSAVLLAAALTLAGCGGHASRTLEARHALDAMQPREALRLIDEELDVDDPGELPAEVGGDNALLLLDRAMIQMQLGDHRLSSRDLEVADKQIEVLDLSRGTLDDIGKYLFSDDTGPYKAPAHEKLLINSMNLVNYLVRGDLNGARVEARRLAVMQRFVEEHDDPAKSLSAPGAYLAGFTFEKSGRPDEALRWYDRALGHGRFRSLEEPVRRLASRASYRSPRLRALVGAEPTPDAAPAQSAEPAEILAVLCFGRVPARYAKRIPIGLALTYASGALSPYHRQRANHLALQGLVTWVNYPEIERARRVWGTPGVRLDQGWQLVEQALDVDREARRAWQEARGAVVAAAITRMLARVVAGEVTRRSVGGVEGLLLGLATQATLTATDTPDTRSWATLPARIAIARVRVAPGTHWIELHAQGLAARRRVTLKPGGWSVVNLTVLG